MKKTVDLTEKLGFEEKPVIMIKKTKIVVNDGAMAALKIVGMASSAQENPAELEEMAKLLFGEEGMEKIEKLELNMKDFQKVVEAAMDLVMGEDDEEAPQNASTI